MHLHGHTFDAGAKGPHKETVNITPMRRLTLQFDASNPGIWALHCHNAYHAEAGMMTVLSYQALCGPSSGSSTSS